MDYRDKDDEELMAAAYWWGFWTTIMAGLFTGCIVYGIVREVVKFLEWVWRWI